MFQHSVALYRSQLMNHVLLYTQGDVLESETAELDAQQQQLDARLTELNKQVIVVSIYFRVACSCIAAIMENANMTSVL